VQLVDGWVGCQERGDAHPLAVAESMTIAEGERTVVVTHVDGLPRNFFEWVDHVAAAGAALLPGSQQSRPVTKIHGNESLKSN
jgi:hypothetical protein